MKVLVVGSGGREHALAWKVAQSPRVRHLWAAPGNAGIAQVAECVPIKADDLDGLVEFARSKKVDLAVIGPEDPLARGLADRLEQAGVAAFGPSGAAAELEASKVFCKRLLAKYRIPTGDFQVFERAEDAISSLDGRRPPFVVKADGLAAGKGVVVARSHEEAESAIRNMMVERSFGEAGARVVVDQYLEGPEVSVMALCGGGAAIPLAAAQDHKAAFDGDQGPNTGGMGCYSPVPALGEELFRRSLAEVIQPTLDAMQAEGRPYLGVLYAGLMLTPEPMVLEFNCRFGDPETQVVLPRLESDLVEAMAAAREGRLAGVELRWSPKACVCVVMASGGYPGGYRTGFPISGLEAAGRLEGVVVFHAATGRDGARLLTAGGRVLGVSALGDGIEEAIDRAYEAVRMIGFEDMHFRTDIGRKALTCATS